MNKKSRFIEYTLDKLAFGDDNKTRSEDIKTFFSKVSFLPAHSVLARSCTAEPLRTSCFLPFCSLHTCFAYVTIVSREIMDEPIRDVS